MAVIDKEKIVAAVQQTDDERILFAINRLLLIEEESDILEWHKEKLDQRQKDLEEGEPTLHNWEDIKDSIVEK